MPGRFLDPAGRGREKPQPDFDWLAGVIDPPGPREVAVDVEVGRDRVGLGHGLGPSDAFQLEGPHLSQSAIARDDVATVSNQRWLEKVRLDQPGPDRVLRAWIPDAHHLATGPAKRDGLEHPGIDGV